MSLSDHADGMNLMFIIKCDVSGVGTHLLIKLIPSDKKVLTNTYIFNPSQFYMTFVQDM